MRYLYSHTIDQLYLFSVEFLALALYFAPRQVGHNVVICATMYFNLQCNNVAKQFKLKNVGRIYLTLLRTKKTALALLVLPTSELTGYK